MEHAVLRIKSLYGDTEFILVGDRNVPEGAIATQEQYENFEPSTAYLTHDGRIMQFNEQIGTKDDIEWIS